MTQIKDKTILNVTLAFEQEFCPEMKSELEKMRNYIIESLELP